MVINGVAVWVLFHYAATDIRDEFEGSELSVLKSDSGTKSGVINVIAVNFDVGHVDKNFLFVVVDVFGGGGKRVFDRFEEGVEFGLEGNAGSKSADMAVDKSNARHGLGGVGMQPGTDLFGTGPSFDVRVLDDVEVGFSGTNRDEPEVAVVLVVELKVGHVGGYVGGVVGDFVGAGDHLG